jgi:hypothetical protein
MSPSDLQIAKAGGGPDVLVRNLFEDYVQDMLEWFEIPRTQMSPLYFSGAVRL